MAVAMPLGDPVTALTPSGAPGPGWTGPTRSLLAFERADAGLDGDGHVLVSPDGVEYLDGAEHRMREMLMHDPVIDLAYFDSLVEGSGRAPEAAHRPGFSPERLLGQDYLGPVVLIRRRLLRSLVGDADHLRLPLAHDRIRQLAARSDAIAHLPQLVYRSAPGPAPDSPVPAPTPVPSAGPTAGPPPVTIVMPTMGATRRLDRGSVTLCLQAVDSIVATTSYRPLEIVVVVTPGAPDDLQNRLAATIARHPTERRPAVRICRDDRPFNFANACNRGAVMGRGDVLVFLNDDTEVVTADWLDRLTGWATAPEIGAVGARLLYGDGSIQHAGIWSRGGQPVHRYQGFRADHPGHLDSLATVQNCVAVTGACLAVATDKFHRAGGFSAEFPSSYNDVDLCLKLDALGHRTVVDPHVILHHHEASSRDPRIDDRDLDRLSRRWRRKLIADPYDNPNHLAPGADEFPPPAPAITLERQRREGYGHPARIWHRPRPVTDLIDLEREISATEEETSLVL